MARAKNNETARKGIARRGLRTNAQTARTANSASGKTRRDPLAEASWLSGPYELMQRFGAEMERVLSDLGVSRGLVTDLADRVMERPSLWSPQVEVIEREGQLVIHADLPGLNKDEIKVDLSDHAITIEGERKQEHEESHNGLYRSERSYGRFYRRIPLPAGVDPDTATARFRNGVLEIALVAPAVKERKARKIEIADESAPAKAMAAGR